MGLNHTKTSKKQKTKKSEAPETSGSALPKTPNTREEGRPAIHWTSAITLRDTVHTENNRVRRAFYRCRLKPDTSPVLFRDLLAINPTANSFPSRLIPPYSPFLDERRGGSSCGNWYNVANQQQRERLGNPGWGVPVGLNCHSPQRPG